jgi:hypothetical protein
VIEKVSRFQYDIVPAMGKAFKQQTKPLIQSESIETAIPGQK